jgi:hypothetical protein
MLCNQRRVANMQKLRWHAQCDDDGIDVGAFSHDQMLGSGGEEFLKRHADSTLCFIGDSLVIQTAIVLFCRLHAYETSFNASAYDSSKTRVDGVTIRYRHNVTINLQRFGNELGLLRITDFGRDMEPFWRASTCPRDPRYVKMVVNSGASHTGLIIVQPHGSLLSGLFGPYVSRVKNHFRSGGFRFMLMSPPVRHLRTRDSV